MPIVDRALRSLQFFFLSSGVAAYKNPRKMSLEVWELAEVD